MITYFAVAENSNLDAASSASMVVAEGEAKGRTTYLAELIEEAAGTRGLRFSIISRT